MRQYLDDLTTLEGVKRFHREDAGLDSNMTSAQNRRGLPPPTEMEVCQGITLLSPIVCTISQCAH